MILENPSELFFCFRSYEIIRGMAQMVLDGIYPSKSLR